MAGRSIPSGCGIPLHAHIQHVQISLLPALLLEFLLASMLKFGSIEELSRDWTSDRWSTSRAFSFVHPGMDRGVACSYVFAFLEQKTDGR
jgi:hypothetical protein